MLQRRIAIVGTFMLLGIAVWSTAQTNDRAVDPRLVGYLAAMRAAHDRGDLATEQQQGGNGDARWEGGQPESGRLEVEIHLADPEALTDAELARLGGKAGDRGFGQMDAWLDWQQLDQLLARRADIDYVQLPVRPTLFLGPHESQGATHFRTPELACLGAGLTPTTVAVLDEAFDGITDSEKSGEIVHLLPGKGGSGGSHGTMCAEVIADVNPDANLVPWSVGSLSAIQAFAKEIAVKGNPRGIRVVSHSVGWFGQSFGRGDGPLCKVVDMVRGADVVWVNASGNNSGGGFYQGIWTDSDGDGKHEFDGDNPYLQFHAWQGASIRLIIDWDDYTGRSIDINATLWQRDGENWSKVNESKLKQGPKVAPAEFIVNDEADAGDYAVTLSTAAAVPEGLRLRIVSTGYGIGSFSVWSDNGNVYDPADCTEALAVGALSWDRYDTGPLESYSSYGPTVDGRQKPEVVAPTGVSTSFGAFYGTSAACPHTAAVAALYRSQYPDWTEAEVRHALTTHATPMGDGEPDTAFGWGRVEVPATALGWQCTQTTELPEDATCATACQSVGTRTCAASCHWSVCSPPAETCNGVDDDCDGKPDNGFGCARGSNGVCTTATGLSGVRTCGDNCAWQGPCEARGVDVVEDTSASASGDKSGCSAARTGNAAKSSGEWLMIAGCFVLVCAARNTLRTVGQKRKEM